MSFSLRVFFYDKQKKIIIHKIKTIFILILFTTPKHIILYLFKNYLLNKLKTQNFLFLFKSLFEKNEFAGIEESL